MKKSTIILLIAMLAGTWANAQFAHLNEVKFESDADYQEYAEQVLDCSYYLLMTPFDKKDAERTAATDFITRWLNGNPAYDFSVSENIKSITEEKEDLIGIYITCFAKVVLEKEVEVVDDKVEKQAIESFISYCNNPTNKVKVTKEMKKLAQLKSSGEISSAEEYFAMR